MNEVTETTRTFRGILHSIVAAVRQLFSDATPVELAPKSLQQWFDDCIIHHDRVLIDGFRHYCPDWGFIPVDTSVAEFGGCTCEIAVDDYTHVWMHQKTGKLYRILEHRLVVLERDLTELILYARYDGTGPIWARPAAEFFDGRFKRMYD